VNINHYATIATCRSLLAWALSDNT
jgi:hypothetical protein